MSSTASNYTRRALVLAAAEHLPGFAVLPDDGTMATKLAGRVANYDHEVTISVYSHWKNNRIIVGGHYYYAVDDGYNRQYFGPVESESPRSTVSADCSAKRLAATITRLLPQIAEADRAARERLQSTIDRKAGLAASVAAINALPVGYRCEAKEGALAWIETAGQSSIDMRATCDGVRVHVTIPADQLAEAVHALMAIKNNPKKVS